MIIYSQSTGKLWGTDGTILSTHCYSGYGDHKFDAASEAIKDEGPIPRGLWVIGEPYDSKRVGPMSIPLYPSDHNAHGRTHFRIHGDSVMAPGTASRGCIIASKPIRREIIGFNDRLLMVIE